MIVEISYFCLGGQAIVLQSHPQTPPPMSAPIAPGGQLSEGQTHVAQSALFT